MPRECVEGSAEGGTSRWQVEASVYWGGELFAVKYFAFGERVIFDDVPRAPSIEVRTRVVEAGKRMRRNGWDLPYGAIALAAAFCQSLVVASIGGASQPKHDPGHPESLAVSSEVFPLIPGELVGPMTSVIPGQYETHEDGDESEAEGEGEDRPPTREELGTFGMVGLLAQYRGTGDTSPWVSARRDGTGTMWGDAIGDAKGIAGIALSGVGEGGGGNGLGNFVLERVHTTGTGEGYGSAYGHLIGRHTSNITCRLVTEVITCNRIPPEIIRRVVHEQEGRFRACYLDGLKRNPKLAGRVTTKFVIARDGTVAAATDGGSDLPDPEVLSCVQSAFTHLEFPATPDGIATVVYPIAMQPE